MKWMHAVIWIDTESQKKGVVSAKYWQELAVSRTKDPHLICPALNLVTSQERGEEKQIERYSSFWTQKLTDDCTDDEYNEENKINDVNIEELVAEEIANKMRNEHCSQGTVNKSTNKIKFKQQHFLSIFFRLINTQPSAFSLHALSVIGYNYLLNAMHQL